MFQKRGVQAAQVPSQPERRGLSLSDVSVRLGVTERRGEKVKAVAKAFTVPPRSAAKGWGNIWDEEKLP